ncbi:rho-related protein racA [Trichonephila clavata]|uniref:Rho-related protein racA n=2 Tax=Trichonephila clavata TaxID=2740835 RepID=A0A8X6K1C0_TRICU|nr:rho-related protein racA [Trichonephila clavata]
MRIEAWLEYFNNACKISNKDNDWKMLNISKYLKGSALTHYINSCLNISNFDDLCNILIENFLKPNIVNLSDFSQHQLRNNLDQYFHQKLNCGRQLGLSPQLILEGLTDGMPTNIKQLMTNNPPTSPTEWLKESDLITREQGRQLANEISAFYYESSVLTQYGVDAVFENAVRLALLARRQQRFWVKSLRNVTSPLLQIPYRPPKPREPETKVLPSTFEEDMYSLLDKEYETDVNLMVGKSRIHSHKIILIAASSHFKKIFISSSLENSQVITLPTFVRLSPSSVQCFLRFLYTGDLSIITNDIVDDLKIAATFTDIAELKVLINNIEKNNLDEKHALRDTFYKKLTYNLKKICLNEQLFVDVTFKLDDGKSYAHRSILMARCAVMKAMFGGDFRESTAEIIPFPGVTKEAFDIFLHYLYTDSVDESLSVENCLPVIELANRLCLPRLISVIELHIVQKLFTMKAKGISLNEQVFKLFEPCQVHNADQLAEWCQYYIIIHYQDISLNAPKLIRSLHPDNQAYLNKNRWPPAHFLKEQEFYDRCLREQESYEKPQRFLMWKAAKKKVSGCLCPKPKMNVPDNCNSDSKHVIICTPSI